jgi:hypothetical protein
MLHAYMKCLSICRHTITFPWAHITSSYPYSFVLIPYTHFIVARMYTRLFWGRKIRKKSLITESTWQGAQKVNICTIKFQCSSLCFMTFTVVVTIDFCNNNANWMKQMNEKWHKIHNVRGKRLTICFIVMQKFINFSMKRTKFSRTKAKVMQFEEWLLKITSYLPQIFTHSLRNLRILRNYFFSVHNKNFFSRFYFHVFRESVLDWKIENLKMWM